MAIQDLYGTMNKYACLALCYAWIVYHDIMISGEALDIFMTKQIMGAQSAGYLDEEFTVKDAAEYLHYLCPLEQFEVTKKNINSLSEIKEATPVRYDYNGHSHWVVVENRKIVWNSLADSQCVRYGKPTTAREIKWKIKK